MDLMQMLGVKPDQMIAGALGAGVALAVSPSMRPAVAFGAVISGLASSWYLPPLVLYYAGWPTNLERPAAFVAGLVGMSLAGALVNIASDPIGAFRKIKGVS